MTEDQEGEAIVSSQFNFLQKKVVKGQILLEECQKIKYILRGVKLVTDLQALLILPREYCDRETNHSNKQVKDFFFSFEGSIY